MGYRLNIDKIEKGSLTNVYYGTKLYGYEDETSLLSFQYLLSIGKIDIDACFDYGCSNELALNKREFVIFVNLYNLDMNRCRDVDEKDYFINQPEIKVELLNDEDEIYIISWC